MPYYDTLEEDLTRAKEILEKGKAEADNDDLPEAVRAWLASQHGGTIYGADIYAAYRLLESFVAEIEQLQSAKAPQRELRLREGRLDDVVIERVDVFRLERMERDRWWMRLYMPTGEDYVFDITTSGRELDITVEVEPRDA
jgi:hypothetical protein